MAKKIKQSESFLKQFDSNKNMIVLGVDPAGNATSKTGYGKTGFFCSRIVNNTVELFNPFQIDAKKFENRESYFLSILNYIRLVKPDAVSCEAYLTRNNAVSAGDLGETQRLIQEIEAHCNENGIAFYSLNSSIASGKEAKYSDKIMLKKGIFTFERGRYKFKGAQVSDHIRRAAAHAVYPMKFWTGEQRQFGKKIL